MGGAGDTVAVQNCPILAPEFQDYDWRVLTVTRVLRMCRGAALLRDLRARGDIELGDSEIVSTLKERHRARGLVRSSGKGKSHQGLVPNLSSSEHSHDLPEPWESQTSPCQWALNCITCAFIPESQA